MSTIKQSFENGYCDTRQLFFSLFVVKQNFMLRSEFFRLFRMNSYLKQVKAAADNRTDILAVMGNESVDLDSAGELKIKLIEIAKVSQFLSFKFLQLRSLII
jgi:hypothetical protein